MNTGHVGSSFKDSVKEWEKKDPNFRKAVDKYKKEKMRKFLKKAKKK